MTGAKDKVFVISTMPLPSDLYIVVLQRVSPAESLLE